jgi:signal transduction histidine kinase
MVVGVSANVEDAPYEGDMSTAAVKKTAKARSTDAVAALSAFATQGYGSAREAVHAIFGLIHELVGLRICVLTRIDLETNTLTVLEAHDGAGLGVASGMVLPADSMPCACVARNAAALREFDLDAHPAFRLLPASTKFGLRSYIGVPLRKSDGTVWGTLAATDTRVSELTEGHLKTLTVLGRLAALEYEREEQGEILAAQAKLLAERLENAEALEEQRLRAARMQAVLEAAATVSHEVNNPLTVLQLRLARLLKRLPPDAETVDDLDVALQAAAEINQVTVRLRNVVRPVSTHYLSAHNRMLDLEASLEASVGEEAANDAGPRTK